MNKKTECKIVLFGEHAREAMISAEELSKGSFGSVRIIDSDEVEGSDKGETLSCFETTVGFALELRKHLIDSGKTYDFKIAVQRSRTRSSWRIAEGSEWILSNKNDKAKRRQVRKGIKSVMRASDMS